MTPDFFKLHNSAKHYEWGSKEWIPSLLEQANPERLPWAELWMGAHPVSPSYTSIDGNELPLGELIAGNPGHYLGEQAARQYGSLPFLLKLLAAEKPLSIQAHPNQDQAREGFQRENRLGLALDAPNRNYKDPNHKPEVICALSPFTGMCGFREPGEIIRLFGALIAASGTALQESCTPLFRALDTDDPEAALRNFLKTLFGLSPAVRQDITAHILKTGAEAAPAAIPADLWELMLRFAKLFPGDPSLLSPLYLNVFNLEPGEAVYLESGTLHAYIYGFAVELMANSDNVLRGGLSPKHIDTPGLMKILEFYPKRPKIIRPDSASVSSFTYSVPCKEFSLSVLHGAGAKAPFPKRGPAICLVTAGELFIQGNNDKAILKCGESVFIPAGTSTGLELRGNYTLYAASLPD